MLPQEQVRPSHLAPTKILDHDDPAIQSLVSQLRDSPASRSSGSFIRAAYQYVKGAIRPVYSLDELQPASTTLREKRGSCSQRIACLEALSRAESIPTRVRGLWIEGRFWYPRFRFLRLVIPKRILLTWPQFYLDGPEASRWVDFDELFASTEDLVKRSEKGFTNTGETLFEAVEHTPVDFLGKSKTCGTGCDVTPFDLSKYVLFDEGFFDTRDELFARFRPLGETFRGKIFGAIWGGRGA